MVNINAKIGTSNTFTIISQMFSVHLTDADGMATSEDPDQTAPEGAV